MTEMNECKKEREGKKIKKIITGNMYCHEHFLDD